MLRCWGSRPDTVVWDEPFYAHYLQQTSDRRHPGYEQTLDHHQADWRRVAELLLAPLPAGKTVGYQKQMAHHLLPEVGREWVDSLLNCFLIRHPAAVLMSMIEFIANPRPEDIGLPQQVELFERERQRTDKIPSVIEANDVLRNPTATLSLLCERVGVPFTKAMLQWNPGPRDSDGAWGPFWYEKVYKTTGFGPPRKDVVDVPPSLKGVLDDCLPLYERLAKHKLKFDG